MYCLGPASRLPRVVARSLGASVGPGGVGGAHGIWVGRGRRIGGHGVLLVCTMGHHRVVDSTVLHDSNVCRVCARACDAPLYLRGARVARPLAQASGRAHGARRLWQHGTTPPCYNAVLWY